VHNGRSGQMLLIWKQIINYLCCYSCSAPVWPVICLPRGGMRAFLAKLWSPWPNSYAAHQDNWWFWCSRYYVFMLGKAARKH